MRLNAAAFMLEHEEVLPSSIGHYDDVLSILWPLSL